MFVSESIKMSSCLLFCPNKCRSGACVLSYLNNSASIWLQLNFFFFNFISKSWMVSISLFVQLSNTWNKQTRLSIKCPCYYDREIYIKKSKTAIQPYITLVRNWTDWFRARTHCTHTLHTHAHTQFVCLCPATGHAECSPNHVHMALIGTFRYTVIESGDKAGVCHFLP